jgi:hypothetical protein
MIDPYFVGLRRAEPGRGFLYGLSRAFDSSAAEIYAKRQDLGDKDVSQFA